MKKLLTGLFIFGVLTIGLKVSAFTLNDALLQIQNLQKEVASLKSQLGAAVWNSVTVTYPKGGESFKFGQDLTITWSTVGVTPETTLNIAIDNIATTGLDNIGLTTSLNTGSKTIKLPSSVAVTDHGDQYKVYIWQGDFFSSTNTVLDSSDSPFTMNAGQSTPLPLTDLKTGPVVISTPDPILPNTKVYFDSEVRNTADGVPLSGFYNHFEVSKGLDGLGTITNVTTNTTYINTVDAKDRIYGYYTPTAVGSYSVRACVDQASVTNTKGIIPEVSETNNCSMWKNISVVASGSSTLPEEPANNTYVSPRVADYSVVYGNPPSVTATTASVGGLILSSGSMSLTERGACYGLTSSPTNCIPASVVQGSSDVFLTNFSGLTSNTTYYYRIYAKNAKETVYSASNTFKTLANTANCPENFPGPTFCPDSKVIPDKYDAKGCVISYKCSATSSSLPTVSSPKAQDITKTSAVLSATISDIGSSNITEKGICYGIGTNPKFGGALSTCTPVLNSSQTMLTVSNLKANTIYYFKGYAKNIDGIGYSEDGIFTTLGTTTPSVTVLSPNSGTEVYTAGQQITVKWKTENYPSTSRVQIVLKSSSGSLPITDVALNDGEETVKLPSNNANNSPLASGKYYKIYVALAGNNSLSDESNEYFTINNNSEIPVFSVKDLLDNKSIQSKYANKEIILKGFVTTSNFWRDFIKTSKGISLYSDIYKSDLNVSKWIDAEFGSTGIMSLIIDKYEKNSLKTPWLELEIKGILREDNLAYYGFSLDSKELSGLNFINNNIPSSSCPTNVPSVSCPEFETEAVKDANGCIIAFKCSDVSLKSKTFSSCSPTSLKVGSNSEYVKALQNFLGITADGKFGRKTFFAVKDWQAKNGLEIDGVFGPISCSKAFGSN